MSNTLLTIDMITKEALRLAHEKATFIGTINRQFDESFGRSEGKIGDTLRIRLPSQYTRRQGSRVMDVQDSEQQKTALTVATQDGVDMRFNSREMALDLDSFSKLHLEPAMATLVSGVESDVLQGCTKKTYNAVNSAAFAALSDLAVPGAARAKLNQFLAPKDNQRSIQMDSVTMGGLVNGLKGLFQDSPQIKEQYREGLIGRTAMADYYENERVWSNVTGADVTGTLDTYTMVDGETGGFTSQFTSLTGVSVGNVFTIAGAYACHPETKAAYPFLKQFVVTGVTSDTQFTFSPAFNFSAGPKQNVVSVSGGVPSISTTAVVTILGTASKTSVQNLMYHKDAFTFATADLPMMADAAKCSVQKFDNISLRVWQASDIRNDEMLTRIDILYGYEAIRPDWACRMIGLET